MTATSDLRKLYLQCRANGTRVDPRTAAIAIRSVGDYATIRGEYYNSIYENVASYLDGRLGIATARNEVKKACATAFVNSFEAGWVDTQGAGATYDPDPEDSAWLASRMEQEFAFIDGMFSTMKDMGGDPEEPLTEDDITSYATDRATGYCTTLDVIYGQGKLRSRKSVMLTFTGPNGSPDNVCQKNNGTCVRLMGKRHSAKYWIARDLVPYGGNPNYTCGSWPGSCQHFLQDDSGNRWTGQE